MKFKKYNYWKIPEKFNAEQDFNENKIEHQFEEQLIKSIKYRLISDVPLGTYLSGGVDSSLITAVTANNKSEELNTYTIGFPELNEFKYSRMIAKKYNTVHHEILIKKQDYVDNWERLIKFKDAPLGVPNEIPLAIMSQKLKEKITVVLSGEGVDELMEGMEGYLDSFDFKNHFDGDSFIKFIDNYEYVLEK